MKNTRQACSLLLACILAASPGAAASQAAAEVFASRSAARAPVLLRAAVNGSHAPRVGVPAAAALNFATRLETLPPAFFPAPMLPVHEGIRLQRRSAAVSSVSPALPSNPIGARTQLEQARAVSAEPETGQAQEAGDPGSIQAKIRQDRFWAGASKSDSGVSLPVLGSQGAPAPTLSAPNRQASSRGQASGPAKPSKATALLGAAAVPMGSTWQHGLASFGAAQYGPYLMGGVALLGAYLVNRVVRSLVEKIGQKLGWDRNKKFRWRFAVGMAVWTLGIALGLNLAGIPFAALFTGATLGAIAAITLDEDATDFLEGVKVLLYQPFNMGDLIMSRGELYRAKDMTPTTLKLLRYKNSETSKTYSQLNESPITVFRKYDSLSKLKAPPPTLPFADLSRRAKTAFAGFTQPFRKPTVDFKKASLWAVLGVGLLLALPALKAYAAWCLFDLLFPVLHGAAWIYATRTVANWVGSFISALGKTGGRSGYWTMALKIFAQVIVYMVGGSFALNAFGVDWRALLTGGLTGLAVTVVKNDVLRKLFRGLRTQESPPFPIDATVEIVGVTGTVADINKQYVVLEHGGSAYTLISHSVLGSHGYTILAPEDIPNAPPPPRIPENAFIPDRLPEQAPSQ